MYLFKFLISACCLIPKPKCTYSQKKKKEIHQVSLNETEGTDTYTLELLLEFPFTPERAILFPPRAPFFLVLVNQFIMFLSQL